MLQLSILLIFTVTRTIRAYTPPTAISIRNELVEADPELSSEVNDHIVDTLAEGLSAGLQITEALEKGFEMLDSTAAVVTKAAEIAEKASLVFGALSSFVSLKDMFAKSAEEEKLDQIIKILFEGFTNIQKGFDSLGHRINDLEYVIKTEHILTRLNPALVDLDNVNGEVSHYLAHPYDIRKEGLVGEYYNAWKAVYQLRNEFITYELCGVLTGLTSRDRRKVLDIVLDLYGIIVRGTSHVVLIAKLADRPDSSQTEKDMDEWLTEVSTSIDDCDNALETRLWQDQWKKDLEIIDDKGNADSTAQGIFDLLSRKYYWRKWFVVVYDVLKGERNHFVWACPRNSITDPRWKNRYSVIVSSSSGSMTTVMRSSFKEFKRSLDWKDLSIPSDTKKLPKSNSAKKIYKAFPDRDFTIDNECPVQITGVVRMYGTKKDFSWKGSGEYHSIKHRFRKWHGFRRRWHHFKVFMMGGV